MKPFVSVVIPSHRPALCAHAVESVRQQDSGFEVEIVVKETPPHVWWPGKTNAAVKAASGKWLFLLADDDLILDGGLRRLIVETGDSGADVAYGDRLNFGDKAGVTKALPWELQFFKATNPLLGMSWLVNRELFNDVGGYANDLIYQDWGCAYECFKAGAEAALVPEPVWAYRWHADQGSNGIDGRKATEQIYAKYPELNPNA